MKRWGLRAITMLALGTVTTVAVSWGIAFFDEDPQADAEMSLIKADVEHGAVRLSANIQELRTATCTVIIVRIPTNLSPAASELIESQLADQGAPRWVLAIMVKKSQDRSLRNLYKIYLETSGWPARAMWAGWIEERRVPLKAALFTGLPTKRDAKRQFNDDTRAVIPFRPIVTGLMINAVFYAAIWFGLLVTPKMTVRFIRKWRGRCPNCGYNVRGEFASGCPECGWGREMVDDGR